MTHRPDAIINLIDALASHTDAKSVAQLSLNPCFDYQYPSVQAQQIQALLAEPAFATQLCVTVVDSSLSAKTFIGEVKSQPN